MNLYITADQIGAETGGGIVTRNESEALRSLGPCEVWGRDGLRGGSDPWGWDQAALDVVDSWTSSIEGRLSCMGELELVHFYSGTMSRTIQRLKEQGCKVAYTIAAHDRAVSRREHERYGVDFARLYPHLCEPELWRRYIRGYALADVIICPGSVPAQTVRDYGPEFENKRIEIIPHGCTLPETVAPLPKQFTVGYLGSFGADKGVRYLLEAWAKLNYRDAVLVLAGRDSNQPWVHDMASALGCGNVVMTGWMKNVADFYNQISVYIQPSATEGFGLEVLEALSFARPALCSEGAGACDVVPKGWTFPACDSDALADKIEMTRNGTSERLTQWGLTGREIAGELTWDKIRAKYVEVWRSLLEENR